MSLILVPGILSGRGILWSLTYLIHLHAHVNIHVSLRRPGCYLPAEAARPSADSHTRSGRTLAAEGDTRSDLEASVECTCSAAVCIPDLASDSQPWGTLDGPCGVAAAAAVAVVAAAVHLEAAGLTAVAAGRDSELASGPASRPTAARYLHSRPRALPVIVCYGWLPPRGGRCR